MPLVLTEVRDGVLTLTMNRPDRYNAMNTELLAELLDKFVRETARDDVHAVVITGAGKAFCAGGDVAAMKESLGKDPKGLVWGLTANLHPLIVAIRRLGKPVVAALNGAVAGGGYGLALACDQRVASDTCTFTPAYRRLGIVPDGGITAFLPRLIGFGHAQRIILNDERIDAQQAFGMGMVDRVVSSANLLFEAHTVAHTLADFPQQSFAQTKELLNRSALAGFEEQLDRERKWNAESAAGPWFAEGVNSFFEKRKPVFRRAPLASRKA